MGLLSAFGSAVSGGFSDIVGDFFSSAASSFGLNLGGFASDILGGAVTNAAVAGLAGGDIGKAALYGAVGGGLSGTGFGTIGSTLGGAVRGYGVDKATGGSGLTGALAGAGGAFLKDRFSSSASAPSGWSSNGANNANRNVSQNGGVQQPNSGLPNTPPPNTPLRSTTSGPIMSKLKSLGLVDNTGQGTLLGKALVTGIGTAAQQKNTEELMDKQVDQEKEIKEHKADVDHEAEQRRIAAFTNKQPTFRVVRNG
ncbi:MAG: hypothetical protein RQ732_09845 [Methylophaga sp.]|nr:hypothetical protein [Methylophaga sp.]